MSALLPVYAQDQAPDPWDYSYCGGKPVYPVIGFNFATFCGPRNQIALGRRGKLMWLFPDLDETHVHARGTRQLTEDELARITLLAEAAQLAQATTEKEGEVRYDLGIDFSGRAFRQVHGVVAEDKSSAMALFAAMRKLVPEAPLLPACDQSARDFRPTRLPSERTTQAGLPPNAPHVLP